MEGEFFPVRAISPRGRTTPVKVHASSCITATTSGWTRVARRCAHRQSSRLGWISQLVEERRGHLRAARIPNTRR
jgi:hypothetical protein